MTEDDLLSSELGEGADREVGSQQKERKEDENSDAGSIVVDTQKNRLGKDEKRGVCLLLYPLASHCPGQQSAR